MTAGSGSPRAEIVLGFRIVGPAGGARRPPRWICGPRCSRAARARACSASWSATASSPTACARSASGRATAGCGVRGDARARAGSREAAEAALDARARVRAWSLRRDDELAAARAALESDLARAGEGPPARARRLGFAAAIARDATIRRRTWRPSGRSGPASCRRRARRSS